MTEPDRRQLDQIAFELQRLHARLDGLEATTRQAREAASSARQLALVFLVSFLVAVIARACS